MRIGFNIGISSDLDYEEMVADIYWNDYQIAIVDYDKGLDNMEIKIFNRLEENKTWKFDLYPFLDALETSERVLLKIQRPKEDEESDESDEANNHERFPDCI